MQHQPSGTPHSLGSTLRASVSTLCILLCTSAPALPAPAYVQGNAAQVTTGKTNSA
jgi:hypothetical protein